MLYLERMDMKARNQYLQVLRQQYLKASKKERSQLLDEAQLRTSLNRKYLVGKLALTTKLEPRQRKPKRRVYGPETRAPLVLLWDIFDQPCGQRLAPLLPEQVPKLRALGELVVTDETARLLTQVKPATIDRLLKREKAVRLLDRKTQVKKHPLLYQQIPTKMSSEWDRDKLGQIQIDGVEHCGQTAAGEFLSTVSHTDIATGWWEGETTMGMGQSRTLEAIKTARERFPMAWVEVHPDNGTPFINNHVHVYIKSEQIKFSRSRPYKKNDNCWAEQKNSTHVRQVVGHLRFDTSEEQAILTSLYREELHFYKNYCQPVMKLESKERDKGHIRRKYDKPQTPYQRVLASDQVSDEVKRQLTVVYEQLNPAELKRRIDAKLKLLHKAYESKQQRPAAPATTKKLTPRLGQKIYDSTQSVSVR
jgi:hypothetical protein